jgi:AcrR family transcriptional regulator
VVTQPGVSAQVPYNAAKARIVDAALELFAANGVGGTSLQMIADRIGVTKAAVYHQFHAKEAIVLAAAEAELAKLEAVLTAAEAEPDAARARETLVTGVVELAVSRRRMESSLLGDPLIVRTFAGHEPFRRVMDRMARLLTGERPNRASRVSAAMFSAAIGGAVMHPMVAALDDDTLRTELLRLARRVLDLDG